MVADYSAHPEQWLYVYRV